MSKRQKLWHFVYFPADDYLMSLGDPSTKRFEELVASRLSDYGRDELKNKDWRTFVIDTELTTYWRKAYEIAANYFGTRNLWDIDDQIANLSQNINAEKESRFESKKQHSEYLKTSSRRIKGLQSYHNRLVREKSAVEPLEETA